MARVIDDAWLYGRMEANLIASWDQYAIGARAARVERLRGAAVAVFPDGPERDVYNNAVLARALDAPTAERVVDEVVAAYAAAGVARYAVWAHESEAPSIAELERRGYRLDTWTRAMAMPLGDVRNNQRNLELVPLSWDEYVLMLPELGAPAGLLAGADRGAFEVLAGTLDGRAVASAIAFEHDGDCGIYNVGTMPAARRRGLATAMTAQLLAHGRRRGCTTASLQATEMAQRLYAAVGFRDLGRFLEYVPS